MITYLSGTKTWDLSILMRKSESSFTISLHHKLLWPTSLTSQISDTSNLWRSTVWKFRSLVWNELGTRHGRWPQNAMVWKCTSKSNICTNYIPTYLLFSCCLNISSVCIYRVTEEKPGWCPDPHSPPCASYELLSLLTIQIALHWLTLHLMALFYPITEIIFLLYLLYLRFVEIMAPVFSRDAWRCVWHMIQVVIILLS